jgi:sec-independent protein translocase protein TatC
MTAPRSNGIPWALRPIPRRYAPKDSSPSFFFSVVEAQVNLSLEGYLGAVIKMMMAFGASFQLPVVVYFLARLGLIDHIDMLRGFRYAIVAIFIVAAIITPPDVLTQVLLSIPLTILYGVGIVVAWLFSTKKRG